MSQTPNTPNPRNPSNPRPADPQRKTVKSFIPPRQPAAPQKAPPKPVAQTPPRPQPRPQQTPPKPQAQTQSNVDAYELEETAPQPKQPADQINRSYLVNEAAPAAPGTKEKEPEPPPGQPKLVDPGVLAQKREDARKRGAEMWAEEEARKKKMFLIKSGVAIAILAGIAIFVWMKWH